MASRSGVNKLLTSGGPGGSVVRHLIPAAIGAAGVVGFLRWRAGDRGLRRDVEAELKRSSRYFELSRDLVCTAGFDGYFKQLNPVVDGGARLERGGAALAPLRGVRPRRRPGAHRGGVRRPARGRRHGRLRQPLRDEGRRLALDRMELDGDPRRGADLRLGARRHPAQGDRGGPGAQRPPDAPDRRERPRRLHLDRRARPDHRLELPGRGELRLAARRGARSRAGRDDHPRASAGAPSRRPRALPRHRRGAGAGPAAGADGAASRRPRVPGRADHLADRDGAGLRLQRVPARHHRAQGRRGRSSRWRATRRSRPRG